MPNFTGNGTKSLALSVKASLEKLQTDYIDLLYVHWWDYSTSIPELMQSLNRLVDQGKVLYLGISDTPAWVVRYELLNQCTEEQQLTASQQSERVRPQPRSHPILRLPRTLVCRLARL